MAASGAAAGAGPGDERPGDELPADHALPIEIPDDARELADELAEYQRELRAARRRARLDRWVFGRRLRRYGVGGPLLVLVVGLVVSVTALFLALGPVGSTGPRQEPLAEPTANVGVINGLIPDAGLLFGDSTKSARSLRPAVLALVPLHCACADVVDNLAHQSGQFGLTLYVVGPSGVDTEVDVMTSKVRGGRATPASDPLGALAAAYDARGVTVVLLRSDGVVRDVVRDVTATTQLGTRLAGLDRLAG
jgi:hypothetical protein